MENERFTVHRYRRDFAHLEYKVVDSEENQVISEALTEMDAYELADAMNSINQSVQN